MLPKIRPASIIKQFNENEAASEAVKFEKALLYQTRGKRQLLYESAGPYDIVNMKKYLSAQQSVMLMMKWSRRLNVKANRLRKSISKLSFEVNVSNRVKKRKILESDLIITVS
ncbi:hypothetical protein ACTFIW_000813 [Dictyostelium discoideum]